MSHTILTDDGMRLRHRGKTSTGSYPIICHENPEHIAYIIAIKREQSLIQSNNQRVWS